jgi:mono/diheme cytochrome c family protein
MGYMISTVGRRTAVTSQIFLPHQRASRRAKLPGAAVAFLAAICLMAGNTWAETPTGQQDYQRYCAVCHGPKGKGNGEASYSLSGTNPPDLTLSKRNGGKFPYEDVYETVDGRKEFPSHERLNMPFFGTNLEIEEGGSPEAKAKADARISAIVHYVESIQQK